MTSQRSRNLWKIGTPLNEAWIVFADDSERCEFDQAPTFLDPTAINLPSGADWMAHGVAALTLIAGNMAASHVRQKLKTGMQEDLLDRLFDNQLTAFAYREAPTTSPAPVQMDADIFDGSDVHWERGVIIGHGKQFGRIRIIDLNSVPIATAARRKRLGSGDAITEAIHALIKTDPAFRSLGRKEACDKIRIKIGKKEESGNGLSNKNLEKFIVRICGLKAIR